MKKRIVLLATAAIMAVGSSGCRVTTDRQAATETTTGNETEDTYTKDEVESMIDSVKESIRYFDKELMEISEAVSEPESASETAEEASTEAQIEALPDPWEDGKLEAIGIPDIPKPNENYRPLYIAEEKTDLDPVTGEKYTAEIYHIFFDTEQSSTPIELQTQPSDNLTYFKEHGAELYSEYVGQMSDWLLKNTTKIARVSEGVVISLAELQDGLSRSGIDGVVLSETGITGTEGYQYLTENRAETAPIKQCLAVGNKIYTIELCGAGSDGRTRPNELRITHDGSLGLYF